MKICYLANTAIPSTNASAIQIVKMCEAFSELKNQVTLITTNASNGNIFNFYEIKTKFNFKKLQYFTKFPLGIKFYLFSFLSIIESLKLKPDFYITRNFFTCFLLLLLKKKTILELHHSLNTEARIVRFIAKNFNFLNSKYLIKLIAITNYVKNDYIKNYHINTNKIIVLPSGSSIKENYNYPLNKKKLNIGYLGSLYKSRGLELIMKLAKIDPKNNYYVYGNKKQIKISISKKIEKNLYLNDYVPYKKISKILLNMDLLLMPYTSSITVAGDVGDITRYTSPLKLFDYLSAGRPIICSNFEVLKEIVDDNTNVIFVKNYQNVFAWKKEITKLKNQSEKMKIISKNNYKLSKKFSLKKRAKKIIDEINSFI
jgi:glycosyltransferase involved in cell wall biosynthesis